MKKANMESLVDEVTDLAISSLRNEFWRKGPKVRAHIRRNVTELLAYVNRRGWWECRRDKKGQMAAFVSGFKGAHPFFGYPFRPLNIYWKRSQANLIWLDSVLRRRRKFFNWDSEIHINTRPRDLAKLLLRHGFFIESVIQMGDVKKGYRRLLRYRKPAKDLSDYGLSVSFLKTRKEIDGILANEKKEFKRNPQFGWFVALPISQKKFRRVLVKSIGGKDVMVLKDKNGKICGSCNVFVGSSPRYGRTAGFGVTVAREYQGKGIAKILYRLMLENALRRRATYYKGGTSQIPVMKLARIMGRKNIMYVLRFGREYFPPEYFGLRLKR